MKAVNDKLSQCCKRWWRILWSIVSKAQKDLEEEEQWNDQHWTSQKYHFGLAREQFVKNEICDMQPEILTWDYERINAIKDDQSFIRIWCLARYRDIGPLLNFQYTATLLSVISHHPGVQCHFMQMMLKFNYRFLLSLRHKPLQHLNHVLEMRSHGWHQIIYLSILIRLNIYCLIQIMYIFLLILLIWL